MKGRVGGERILSIQPSGRLAGTSLGSTIGTFVGKRPCCGDQRSERPRSARNFPCWAKWKGEGGALDRVKGPDGSIIGADNQRELCRGKERGKMIMFDIEGVQRTLYSEGKIRQRHRQMRKPLRLGREQKQKERT